MILSKGEFALAIDKVTKGGKYVSATLAELLVTELDDADKVPHERLSDREFEIMCLIASGKTVSEVAQQLFLSIKTISTYRTRVLEKMGTRSLCSWVRTSESAFSISYPDNSSTPLAASSRDRTVAHGECTCRTAPT